ncbi:hypothetical protein COTS27_01046 [Spirochaetota bacterium]|nr:hypothetical protein COTS27_01046 [Spirochaetota bacterium]
MESRDDTTAADRIFAAAFKELILIEGGYTDNPLDSGGKTCYGITEQTARSWGYRGRIDELPLETARAIYKKHYWTNRSLDQVAAFVPRIATKLFDAGVNVGGSRSTRWLQLALNALNNRSKRWTDLHVDGILAKDTIAALKQAILVYHMEETIYKALNCMQGNYYIELALTRKKDQVFLRGWLDNRIFH